MSRLVIPIVGRTLYSTGDVKLRVELQLSLRDGAGGWHKRAFLVDTGTEVTIFPAYEARQDGLPMPQQPTAGAAHTQTGLDVRSGFLRFRIDGMDQTEYTIGALFLGDPNTQPDPRQPAIFPRMLLQPFALVDWLRFTVERDPARGNTYGELVVEKV